MILLNGKYRLKKNKEFWELGELVGKDYKYSFHPTIKKACDAIIDRELGHCDTIEEVLALLIGSQDMLVKKVEDSL